MKILIMTLVLPLFLTFTNELLAQKTNQSQPEVNYIEEMVLLDIELEENWNHDCPKDLPKGFDQKWSSIVEYTKNQITSQMVRDLSRYAHEQMEAYEYHTSIMPAGFEIVGCTDENIVYSTRLDYLPSHSPLVTRYLEMMVVTTITNQLDPIDQTLVLVTIRGQLEE